MKPAKHLSRNRKGAGLVEYGLLVGLVAVTSIGAVAATGSEVQQTFCVVVDQMASKMGRDTNLRCTTILADAGVPGSAPPTVPGGPATPPATPLGYVAPDSKILVRFEGGASFTFYAGLTGNGSIAIDVGNDGTVEREYSPQSTVGFITVALPPSSSTIVAIYPTGGATEINAINFGYSTTLVEVISFGDESLNLLSIGQLGWQSPLVGVAPLPPTVRSLISTFSLRNLAGISGLETWDTSGITAMGATFYEATFDQQTSDIVAGWDVGQATDFAGMFFGSNFSGDISLWDVGSGQNFSQMFRDVITIPTSLSAWCTRVDPYFHQTFQFAENSTPNVAAALDASNRIRVCP